MAKARKSKPRDRWSISLIKATPAKYLGQVFATSEAEAIKEAVKEFNVAEVLRDRIVVRRENYSLASQQFRVVAVKIEEAKAKVRVKF